MPENRVYVIYQTNETERELSSRKAGRDLALQVNAHGFDQIAYVLKDKALKKLQATVEIFALGRKVWSPQGVLASIYSV